MKLAVRHVALGVLVAAGTGLAVVLGVNRVGTAFSSSLAPAFELLGTPVKAVDHLVTRVIPIDDLDERDFGEVLRAHYQSQADTTDSRFRYVNELLTPLTSLVAKKPFEYHAYLIDYPEPNAMALPGGVLLVTDGLLRALRSEAELVAVLGHEVGHVELGHCLDAVKFQLLADKVGGSTLGQIVDFAVRILLSHSFSKTQEDDADEYAYAALEAGPYDPRGMGWAFSSFLRHVDSTGNRAPRTADPFRDYFLSHPPLELREVKFRERAEAWWLRHPNERRVVGEFTEVPAREPRHAPRAPGAQGGSRW